MPLCSRNCGTMLKFDNAVRSQSGKMIPLEMNGERHQCPNSEYTQQQQQQTTAPQQQTQQVAKPESQQNSSVRSDVWLIPKDDWDKVLSNIQTMTAQLSRLSEYYGDMLDHVRLLSQNQIKNRQMPDAETNYDQDKEDGFVGSLSGEE